jgi:hypothetical protein
MAEHRELARELYAHTLGQSSAARIWRTVVFAGAMLATPLAGCGGGAKKRDTTVVQPDHAAERTEQGERERAAADAAATEQAERERLDAEQAERDRVAAEEAAERERVAAEEAERQRAAAEAAKRPRGTVFSRPKGRGFVLA